MARSAHILFILTLLAPLTPAQDAPAGSWKKSLTFRDSIVGRGLFAPRRVRARWGPEKKLLRVGRKWIEPLSGRAVEAPPRDRSEKKGGLAAEMRAALARALSRDEGEIPIRGRRVMSTVPRHAEGNPGILTAEKAGIAVALVDNDLWVFESGKDVRRLTTTGKVKRQIQLSPSGEAVSYIEDFNLFIARTGDGKVLQLSHDGGENLFYGELDWVYQEEIWGRFQFKGAWWSSTGSHLGYVRIDEEGVPAYTVTHFIPHHPKLETLKYPKAGDTNPRISLLVADARATDADHATVSVDLSKYADREFLIVRVGWTPDGKRLLFQVQDREQTWLDLNAADVQTGRMRTLIHEESSSWVNILDGIHWLRDGDFIWESERTGYRHLYRYGSDGTLKGAITSGEWQVTSVDDIDEDRGEIIFHATKDGAVNRNVYVVRLNGTGLRRLTPGEGTHSVSWNADKTLYIDSFTSMSNPGITRLYKRDGTLVRELGRAEAPARAEDYGFSRPELISVKARDGYELDAMLIKPRGFDEKAIYPVWVEGYFGPDAPTVRNAWHGSTWHQFLAQQGIIVFSLNVRSASGRGQKHTATCYQKLGVQELEDIVDAVDWLTSHSWADRDRVGISGYSYGGFMAAYALLNSDRFKLGVAGGGVYDWRNYDTMYTERYMRTPQNNPDGYDRTSCVKTARGLKGHLVIHHGTIDENVHLQNAMQLIYALQTAGKGVPGASFELMLYPNNRHGFQERAAFMHSRRMLWRQIQKHLIVQS